MFFEILAYALAGAAYFWLRRRLGDRISTPERWVGVTAAVAGGAIGSKVLFWFEDPQLTLQNLHNPVYLLGGKTIVGALVFGLVSVELMKRYVGIQRSTGDLYAVPLTLGIAIGRVGCFLTGLEDNTYGVATSLPWGINFGDGIRRHPVQLYEAVFLLFLVYPLYRSLLSVTASPSEYSRFRPGDTFKFFLVAYLSFRLLFDFIKPYSHVFLGLGGIQWACLLVLIYYSSDIARWARLSRSGLRNLDRVTPQL